jgi:hypothetical protein
MSEGKRARDWGSRVVATPGIKKVAACARFARSGERGTEAAPATSER